LNTLSDEISHLRSIYDCEYSGQRMDEYQAVKSILRAVIIIGEEVEKLKNIKK
jgi:hypothetical protein